MHITPHKQYKSDFLAWLFRVLYIVLDNSDDSKPSRNGEDWFMRKIADTYTSKDFVLFDVGANRGDYTDTLLHGTYASFSAHLFEPQPECVATLKKRFVEQPAIHVLPFGLSDTKGSAALYSDGSQSPVASLYNRDLRAHDREMHSTGDIQLTRGEDYITETGVTHIDLLKIDVEGHELSVLHGLGNFLSPENIDFVQFEYGGANIDSRTTLRELHTLLTGRGFVLCKLMRRGLEVRPFTPALENFRYQNWIAVHPRYVDRT